MAGLGTARQGALTLASFKIRVRDGHVRALPERGLDGCAFAGPGVDLRGDDAERAIAASAPIVAWLDAREPGIRLRSLSVDLRTLRVLVTLETGDKPRVLRFDPPQSSELVTLAGDAARIIGEACAVKLASRA